MSEVFRWSESDGIVGLGRPQGFNSGASDVSSDGSVVVGNLYHGSNSYQHICSPDSQAYRWTEDEGFVGLGFGPASDTLPPEGGASCAAAVSSDGSIIVGGYWVESETPGENAQELFVWDPENGMRNLADVLTDHGADLEGIPRLQTLHGLDVDISYDGRTIVGSGRDPSGEPTLWIASFRPVVPASVRIDIRPHSDRNRINPTNRGRVPVAIFGSDSFDVSEIDVDTLKFGPEAAAPAHRRGGHRKDVNRDGLMDLVSHYRTRELGLAFGDTEACVTGETFDGILFEGCDSIRVQVACGFGFELAFLLPPILWSRRRRSATQ